MIENDLHIVFDLDDTIYKEIDYVESAFNYINNYIKLRFKLDLSTDIKNCINNNLGFYDLISQKINKKDFSIDTFLELYRFHYPKISLSKETSLFLNKLISKNIGFSVITDGRSISQRNKLHALGLTKVLKNIIISDETGYQKPHLFNFKILNDLYPDKKLIYIADNPSKDFLAPNLLNWKTICLLDDGKNIHKQNFNLGKKYIPKECIKNFNEFKL